MVTDDERREVARRLRDSAEERMAVKGTGNGNNWSWLYRSIFGHYMGTKNGAKGHYVEVAHRLADLIEPSCDRDALLELADELDRSATELLKTNDLDSSRKRRSMRMEHAQDLMAASSRIRRALGVNDA